jgi:hypothetical protein
MTGLLMTDSSFVVFLRFLVIISPLFTKSKGEVRFTAKSENQQPLALFSSLYHNKVECNEIGGKEHDIRYARTL